MKKYIKVIILIILCGLIVSGIFIYKKYCKSCNIETPNTKEIASELEGNKNDENQSIVKIVDGKIQNEDLIDEFIEKTSSTKENMSLQIEVDNENQVEVEFIPSSDEDIENRFGYYLLKRDEKETKFSVLDYHIARNTIDETVYLIFDTVLGENKEDPMALICSYDLDSSSYKKDFELNFNQRKDMGAKKIIGPESSVIPMEYAVYTVGGDVTFTIEDDMVYDFEKALKEKVITVEQILEQAKMDDKYGMCREEMYQDGGTTEYLYDDYTIIKYNTLDGNQDFVIGPKGDNIRNKVDEILYNQNDDSGTKAVDIEFNRSPENVTIKVIEDTISRDSASILITDNNEDKYGWGEEFGVQEKVNGEWKDLDYISDNLSWIAIAYELNEDNQLTQKLNIKEYYGELSNGIYRIVKQVYDNGYVSIYSDEFEIK